MKTSRTALILGLALSALAAKATAQIYSVSTLVTGANTAITTRFTFELNLATEKLLVKVDNTVPLLSTGGVNGTVISFGFNTPFTGLTTSDVTTKAKWVDWNGSSRANLANQRTIDASSSSFWEEHSPYVISHATQYNQDFGVSTKDTPSADAAGLDNINQGIQYGEIAFFEFTFTNASKSITQQNYKQFFGNNFVSVYWRQVADADRGNCEVNNGWDKGHGDFFPPSDGDLPPTPEPSTYGLMGAAALLGLVAHRRHKAKKAAKTA